MPELPWQSHFTKKPSLTHIVKTLILKLLAFGTLVVSSWSQAPVPPPSPPKAPAPAAKLTPKDVRVLPFCREFEHQKFKANDRDLPDELHVTFTDRIHLYGKRRGDVVKVTGRSVGHVGKVVLLPAGDRAGKLVAKVPVVDEVTYYYAVLEMADDSLETKLLRLAKDKSYDWSMKTENGQSTLRLLLDGKEFAALNGPSEKVKGYGFAATVRSKGNEADLLLTFN